MTRVQKLRWYAGQLIADARAEVKAGCPETATSHYLQAADILLLLAKFEENYTSWKQYTDTAAQCQKEAKALISLKPNVESVS